LQIFIKLQYCNYDRYFQLLMLVKKDSIADYLWVSFVEELHRHAATILALLCRNRNHDSCEKSATGTENTGIRRIPAEIGNLDGKCSIVTKLKPRGEVTKNGKPFTNITSTTNITYLCSCTNPEGSAHIDLNAFRFCPSHFPPKVSKVRKKTSVSGLSTSCMVMGQLVNSCSRTIPANSLLMGVSSTGFSPC
jgi:hypothetical protein